MEFPERVTRPFRRGALAALCAGAAFAAAGFALSAIVSYHVGESFRSYSEGQPVQPPDWTGTLFDASRTLAFAAAAFCVLGLIGLSVASAAAWPAKDAKRSLVALGVGVGVAFLITMLDELGGRPEGPTKPMFLGLATVGALLCAHQRAALLVALAGAAAMMGRAWQGAQYPPWFEPRDMLLPRWGAEAIWASVGFLLLAAALAISLLGRSAARASSASALGH